MYYSTETEINLDDLAEALKEPGDENSDETKAELEAIEGLLKEHALAEIQAKIVVGDILLHDIVNIVPSVKWCGEHAYLELMFYAGICESTRMMTATATFPLHDVHVEKTNKSIRIDEALDRYPEIHFVEE